MIGGGNRARPGEISLAHRGVLFLDEWPEFPRPALEALRQPMETGRTTISRAQAHVTYPARFQCIAAMNPCRCGYLGEAGRECGRAPRCGEDYQAKLSGPLLDRMDLTIEVTPIPPAELARAHAALDKAVDAAYGYKGKKDDASRVAYLFGLYQQLAAPLAAVPAPTLRRRAAVEES